MWVFRFFLKTASDNRSFHTRAPAIPNARLPTVRSLVRGYEVPSVGVLLPISGVAADSPGVIVCNPVYTQCPSSSTQAQYGYGNEKVRPVDTWCALGLATNEGPWANEETWSYAISLENFFFLPSPSYLSMQVFHCLQYMSMPFA